MILEEMLHASAKRVDEEYTSMMRRRACCAAGVILRLTVQTTCLPIGLVQNDEFVLSFRKSHLLLREQLDFLSNDVDTSGKRVGTDLLPIIRGIQFDHCVLIRIAEHRFRQTHDARGLSSSGRSLPLEWIEQAYCEENVREVSFLRNHLKPFD